MCLQIVDELIGQSYINIISWPNAMCLYPNAFYYELYSEAKTWSGQNNGKSKQNHSHMLIRRERKIES